MDGHLVVSALKKGLTLKVHQPVLSGPQEDANQLVADADVDVEQTSELYGADCGGETVLANILTHFCGKLRQIVTVYILPCDKKSYCAQ